MDVGTGFHAGIVSPVLQPLSALSVAVTVNNWLFEMRHSVMFLLKVSLGGALSIVKNLQEPGLTGLCFVLYTWHEARAVYLG